MRLYIQIYLFVYYSFVYLYIIFLMYIGCIFIYHFLYLYIYYILLDVQKWVALERDCSHDIETVIGTIGLKNERTL